MVTTTHTRPAKCKDCKFCKSFYDGKLKKHTCLNENSEKHTSIIKLNDFVCDSWELIYT
ncbi:hypothetical protein Phi46:3_gp104 [Cellulophaga phage phi46:3]|uniref:Uncharacterized protein n=1 Tax=Cellulophaga phage phi46:3 TaxID=1327985 RepID=S0A3N6_9CAUD|nr:hypothetical protein Phi46:3_gp104 [Cellulophaga phage phi46:3]AGO48848.1 hypothetical protein Phi46:3_gp104 [Cellulophaga phage phi46:3]